MLIVLCLNINMANYLRFAVLAQLTEHEKNISNCRSDWNEADYYQLCFYKLFCVI